MCVDVSSVHCLAFFNRHKHLDPFLHFCFGIYLYVTMVCVKEAFTIRVVIGLLVVLNKDVLANEVTVRGKRN